MIWSMKGRMIDSVKRQRGVALGIVVWFIAGMTLLVSGIIADARIDTRMAQLHYFRAQAAAAGDGAINLALAEQEGMRASGQRGANRLQNYQIGPRSVEVRMIPAGVFVNISSEDLQGLRSLFGLAASQAQQLLCRRPSVRPCRPSRRHARSRSSPDNNFSEGTRSCTTF